MNRDRCYIAGKIGNLPEEEVIFKFLVAKEQVEEMGFEPVSPLDLDHSHNRSWSEYMKEDLTAMFTCKHLYALKDWRHSPGATIEINLALQVGINIIHQK